MSTLQKIINDFGATLLTHSKEEVIDISTLPYPKDLIKSALMDAYKATKDASARNVCEVGLIQLTLFQSLTHEEKDALKKWREITEAGSDKLEANLLTVATVGDTVTALMQKTLNEAEAIRNELKGLSNAHT